MRKSLVLLSAAALVITFAALSAGDIHFRFITYHPFPDYQKGSMKFTDTQAQALEMHLVGGDGGTILELGGCPKLYNLYTVLTTTGKPYLDRIAKMGSGHVYIYFVDDRNGLSAAMIDFAGLCDYTDGDRQYTWLCGHTYPERAVKIGEHFAGKFQEAFAASYGADGAPQALAGLVMGELIRTVSNPEWQPNDILLKPGTVTAISRVETRERSYSTSTSSSGTSLTMAPTLSSAVTRGMEIFFSISWSQQLRSIYEEFYSGGGSFQIRRNSEVHMTLSKRRANSTDEYDTFIWNMFLARELENCEVFIGLMLHYFAQYLPPRMDDGKQLYSLEAVLSAFGKSKYSILSFGNILLETINNSGADASTKKDYYSFLVYLYDMLTGYRGARGDIEAFLREVTMDEAVIKETLDAYMARPSGDGSLVRAALKAAVEGGGKTLSDKVDYLARFALLTKQQLMPSS